MINDDYVKTLAKMKRNMIVEYDNIIQSIDYGFLESLLYTDHNKLKFLRMLNLNDRIYFINNRHEEDIFKFITAGEITKDNYKNFNIDINQYSEIYFKEPAISEFSNGLKSLLLSKSIDKLLIAVDVKNKYKLKTLDILYHEYSDLIKICDISNINKHIKDNEYNTIVANEDIIYKNKKYLKGKSIMIPLYNYMWKKEYIDDEEILITKKEWEKNLNLDIVFFHPFKLNKPKLKIIGNETNL